MGSTGATIGPVLAVAEVTPRRSRRPLALYDPASRVRGYPPPLVPACAWLNTLTN